jgi:hypothetical protein
MRIGIMSDDNIACAGGPNSRSCKRRPDVRHQIDHDLDALTHDDIRNHPAHLQYLP